MINLRIVTQPTAEPLTLQEAMEQMNISLDDRHKDEWILRNIKAARRSAEEFLNRSLTDAVYELRIDRFTCPRSHCHLYESTAIPLPIGDIGSIVSVKYIDTDGDEQTLDPADYVFDDNPDAPVVRRAYGACWPRTRCEANAVRIRFRGRYSEINSPTLSPSEDLKQGMLMMLGHVDVNREAVVAQAGSAVEIPMGAKFLLQPYRLGVGV